MSAVYSELTAYLGAVRSSHCRLNVTGNTSIHNSSQKEPESVLDKTVESSIKTEVIGRFTGKTETHCFTKTYNANLKREMESNCNRKRLAMYTPVFPKLLSKISFS